MTDTPVDDSAEERDQEIRADLEAVREVLAGRHDALALAARLSEGVLEESGLDLRTFHLVRLAALAASGAPAPAWEANFELAEGQVTVEEIEGVLRAIVPIIGTARYLDAVQGIIGAS